MPKNSFTTQLFRIKNQTIAHLPAEASLKLPSRGITMVEGTFNGIDFKTLLEPDGKYGQGLRPSHWFRPNSKLLNDAKAKVGDTVTIEIEPTKEWIEPEVPMDMKNILNTSQKAKEIWDSISPLGRWDWVRWVRAVKTPETRKKHLEVMMSKLNKGIRRPCCFNRSLCSDPEVSNNWVLLDESE